MNVDRKENRRGVCIWFRGLSQRGAARYVCKLVSGVQWVVGSNG